jgi:hypothetical protein
MLKGDFAGSNGSLLVSATSSISTWGIWAITVRRVLSYDFAITL